jgi:hypothetical protein
MAVVTSLSQPSLALARLANHRTQLLDWQTTEPSFSTGKPRGTLDGYVKGDVCVPFILRSCSFVPRFCCFARK